jgi:hypothetical protein
LTKIVRLHRKDIRHRLSLANKAPAIAKPDGEQSRAV